MPITTAATALSRIPARRQWLRLLVLAAFLATALVLQHCGGMGGAFAPNTAHAQSATPVVSAGYVYVQLGSAGRFRVTRPSGSLLVTCQSGGYHQTYVWADYSPGNWSIKVYRGACSGGSSSRTYTRTMPTASLTASDVGNATATLTSNVGLYGADGKTGYLYYQADAGPDASCLRALSNALSLSGLTAGQTYTYSAYNDSSCSSTGLATATFTTIAATISPALDNLRVQVRSDYTLTLGGAAGDVYTVEPLSKTTMTYDGTEYTATYPLVYTMQSESDALSISLLVSTYSSAGIKVTDAQNQEAVMEKILGYPSPDPSPTASTDYADEVKLHVTGGLAQVTAVYRGTRNREYRLELRDPGTQAALSSRTSVVSGSGYTYVAPVVFSGLQAGRLYGVCLTVYGGDSLSTYNDEWLCYTATTALATPGPIRPTSVPPTAVSANPTATPLPVAAPGNLFGVPTVTPEPPPPAHAHHSGPYADALAGDADLHRLESGMGNTGIGRVDRGRRGAHHGAVVAGYRSQLLRIFHRAWRPGGADREHGGCHAAAALLAHSGIQSGDTGAGAGCPAGQSLRGKGQHGLRQPGGDTGRAKRLFRVQRRVAGIHQRRGRHLFH